MKVGSIVECVGPFNLNQFEGEVVPSIGGHYTVREIRTYPDGIPGLLFEEIINAPRLYNTGFKECSYESTKFRELSFPPELSREIEEALSVVIVQQN